MKNIILIFFICLFAFSSYAASIELNKEEQKRAEALYQIVRCPVCAGQSIGDSDADISADLRLIIDKKIKSGQTDTEIKSHLADIYGQDILFEPPNNIQTFFLNYGIWGLMLFAFGIFIHKRKNI